MPRRSKIATLPADIKEWLDAALVKSGHGHFEQLSAELAQRGFAISKSTIGVYSQDFEKSLKNLKIASEQAKAVVAAAPDDEDAMSQALVRIAQEQIFKTLQVIEVDPKKVNITNLTRSIAELVRSSTNAKRWAVEVRGKMDAKLAEMEKAKLGNGKRKFDSATLKEVREQLYGIVTPG
jgi:hypothetical protein